MSLTPTVFTIISFGCADWGFSDASIPRLRRLIADLERLDMNQFPNRLVIHVRGNHDGPEAQRALNVLRDACKDPHFEGFRVGVSSGFVGNRLDSIRLETEAIGNEDKAAEPGATDNPGDAQRI